HGNADQAIFVHDVLLGEAGGLEHDRGRVVEHREIARVIDDVGGIAISPLDLDITPVHEHGLLNLASRTTAGSPLPFAEVRRRSGRISRSCNCKPYFGAMRSEASRRTTSPLR